MNCLAYALRFWKEHPEYRIWYNSFHCINLPEGSSANGFLIAEAFGYEYFSSAFNMLLTDEEKELLMEYFGMSKYTVPSMAGYVPDSSSIGKVPIYRGCSNKTCFCDGSCQQIVGYRDRIPGEII